METTTQESANGVIRIYLRYKRPGGAKSDSNFTFDNLTVQKQDNVWQATGETTGAHINFKFYLNENRYVVSLIARGETITWDSRNAIALPVHADNFLYVLWVANIVSVSPKHFNIMTNTSIFLKQ